MEALGINLGLLIVQIIAFIIVFLTLNAWVYKPMLDMMETRKTENCTGSGRCPCCRRSPRRC